MRSIIVVMVLLFPCTVAAQASDLAEAELLRLHAELIRAHTENRPDLWMSLESSSFVSVNGGAVTFPSAEERAEGRASYLRNATFSTYRDVRDPIVRVSDDGTLGWLIAEVEVAGTLSREDGTTRDFHDVWAWVELYERTDAGWKLVGNASNSRAPGTPSGP